MPNANTRHQPSHIKPTAACEVIASSEVMEEICTRFSEYDYYLGPNASSMIISTSGLNEDTLDELAVLLNVPTDTIDEMYVVIHRD